MTNKYNQFNEEGLRKPKSRKERILERLVSGTWENNKPVTKEECKNREEEYFLYAIEHGFKTKTKDKVKSRPYLLESFKDTASFISIAYCTLSQDTTNFKTGTSALKSVATQVDYPARITKNVNWNLSNMQDLEIVFYIEDITKFSSIEIYLFKDTNA